MIDYLLNAYHRQLQEKEITMGRKSAYLLPRKSRKFRMYSRLQFPLGQTKGTLDQTAA